MGATPELATGRLSSVGLNSVPTWLRPYGSLSNGERQRAALARRLGHGVGVDDFGAEVDARTLRSTAAAVRKYVARAGLRGVVLASARVDCLAALQPDWVVIFDAAGAPPRLVANPRPRESRRVAATVAARPETKAQLQTGPVAYRALAGAPKLLRFCREVSLTSRVAVDAHARAASAAFDYAHDGAVSTTVVFPPFDEAGDGAVFGVPRSGYAVGAVSGPSGSGKSTLLRGEFSGKALPPRPPGATVFEAAQAAPATPAPRSARSCACRGGSGASPTGAR
ncbi:hypothetical protein JL722_11523 [Aureococcus anophagefferens]|nr:hypothetical protein JL722_11523 [Aureococcus anophagefferens]